MSSRVEQDFARAPKLRGRLSEPVFPLPQFVSMPSRAIFDPVTNALAAVRYVEERRSAWLAAGGEVMELARRWLAWGRVTLPLSPPPRSPHGDPLL